MKDIFKSIGKVFTKSGNSIANSTNKLFSKNSMNTFRDKLGGVLAEQGKVLSTVGKIGTGIALNPITLGLTGVLAPELLPFVLGAGALSAGVGAGGMIETAGSNLLKPKLYKGNKLQATGNVVNQIEKAGKGGGSIAKFAF